MAKEPNKNPLSLSNLALGFAMIAIPALIVAFTGGNSDKEDKAAEIKEEKEEETGAKE